MKKAYLKANKVSDGIFSNESFLSILDCSGTEVFGFFHKSLIKDGCLEVRVIKENENTVLIGAPDRFLEMNSSIYVKRSYLEYIS